jgi:two-component system, cell cycle sensor histidine kinase and response regulator CckA
MGDRGGPALILVVDDTAAVRALIVRALAEVGHQVLAARSAEHALAAVAECGARLDLAILDVHLPGTNGPTLAAVLRRDRPELRVLFISGDGDSGEHALGEEPLLAKPFHLNTLVRCVADLLTKGRSDSCTPAHHRRSRLA